MIRSSTEASRTGTLFLLQLRTPIADSGAAAVPQQDLTYESDHQ